MDRQEAEQVETEWVAQAQQGDREAFCHLVRQYRPALINVVYRMCGTETLAEDAAQEAFVRAWQRLPDYRPGGSFRGWLYRIAVNLALDMLRRERPASDLETLELADPGQPVETQVERVEQAEHVRRAVLALPPACRAVLVLREYQDLSYQEIAAALSIPLGTVMSRLSYARKLLLERLSPELEVA